MIQALLLFLLFWPQTAANSPQEGTQPAGVLEPAQMQTLFPSTVYFSGQTATVQIRNSGGVRWREKKQTLFALIDSSGYSSAMRDRYQFYILSDVSIRINGRELRPGAYGGGFLNGTGFEVMDLGGTELFRTPVGQDSGMRRPRPLQVISVGGKYRLYLGREYVEFSPGQE